MLVKTGETVITPEGLSDVVEFQARSGVFKSVHKAVERLYQTVHSNPLIEFAHIQIKGQLTNNKWVRVVFLKKDDTQIQPCAGLRHDIWSLFSSQEKLKTGA